MNIVIDFDSTILNTSKTLLNWYNRETGDNLEYNPNHKWDFDGLFPTEYHKRAFQLFTYENLYWLAEEIEGACETINKLISEGHKITIATKHHIKRIPQTDKWIKENIPGASVVYLDTFDKSVLRGDIFIDDRLDCLDSARDNFTHCICFGNYDWNKDCWEGYIRVTKWEDIYMLVNLGGE